MNPLSLFRCRTEFHIPLLSVIEIHTEYGNEQIDTEDTSNQYEEEKEANHILIIIKRRPYGITIPINQLGIIKQYLVHVIRPAFQSAQHKQTDKTSQEVVEIYVMVPPNRPVPTFPIVRKSHIGGRNTLLLRNPVVTTLTIAKPGYLLQRVHEQNRENQPSITP